MKGENGKMKSDLAQTEIEAPYELPEDWKWCRLGEVCKFENGYAFKSDKFTKQGIPVVRITNLKDLQSSLTSSLQEITITSHSLQDTTLKTSR